MSAERPFPLRPKSLERALRRNIAGVGLEANPDRAKRLKGVPKEKPFDRPIEPGPPRDGRQNRESDLKAPMRRLQIEKTRRPEDRPGGLAPNHPSDRTTGMGAESACVPDDRPFLERTRTRRRQITPGILIPQRGEKSWKIFSSKCRE